MKFDPFSGAKCLESSGDDKLITAKDERNPKRKFILDNKGRRQIRKYRVDGCLIKEGKKCDYLLVDCDNKHSYFVELKGRHLTEALKQIDNTLSRFSSILLLFNAVKARIIGRQVNPPDLISSDYIKLLKRLKSINKTPTPAKELLKQQSGQMREVAQ